MILICRNYGFICLGIIHENCERKFRIERAESNCVRLCGRQNPKVTSLDSPSPIGVEPVSCL